MIGDRIPSNRSTALLAFALTVNLAPFATFAAVLPEIARSWSLSASDAGWISGVYFGGYAAAVPILSSLTDRIDGRRIFLGSTLLGAGASLAFAIGAQGFWTALLLRFLGGVALGGVNMPGLKLLAERTAGSRRARGSAVYAACYTLGASASFFIAGAVDTASGWRGAFALSGLVPLAAIGAILLLPPPSERVPSPGFTLDLRPLLRNRLLMAYVLAFAGNLWEVSAIRAWFVAYLAWIFALPHNALTVPRPANIAAFASLAGFVASLLVAELALRWRRAIVAACIGSVLVLLALAATAGGPSLLVLPLLILAQIASLADAAALASGTVVAADPARRGAALALFAFIGYVAAFIGPVAVGMALHVFGGASNPAGWTAAFLVMALGSTAAAFAMRGARKSTEPPPY